MQHRRLRVRPAAEEAVGQRVPVDDAGAGLALVPIGHDRVLLAILRIFGLLRIGRRARAVVAARVAEAERVAEFVDDRRLAIATDRQIAIGEVAAMEQLAVFRIIGARIGDEDVAEVLVAALLVREIGVSLRRIPRVGELDVRAATFDFAEGRGDQIVPQAHGDTGRRFLVFGEGGEAVTGRKAVTRIVVDRDQPVAFVEEGVGDRVVGGDLLRAAGIDLADDLVEVEDRLAAERRFAVREIVEIEVFDIHITFVVLRREHALVAELPVQNTHVEFLPRIRSNNRSPDAMRRDPIDCGVADGGSLSICAIDARGHGKKPANVPRQNRYL